MNKETFNALTALFSDEGFYTGLATLKVDGDLISKITKEDEDLIRISFTEVRPSIQIKILRANLLGIKLGPEGGVLEIESFPDIPFRYSWLEK